MAPSQQVLAVAGGVSTQNAVGTSRQAVAVLPPPPGLILPGTGVVAAPGANVATTLAPEPPLPVEVAREWSAEDLQNLVAKFGRHALHVAHSAWIDPSQTIVAKLLEVLGRDVLSERDEHMATAAFLLLPGVIRALQWLKYEKPIEFLRRVWRPQIQPCVLSTRQEIFSGNRISSMHDVRRREHDNLLCRRVSGNGSAFVGLNAKWSSSCSKDGSVRQRRRQKLSMMYCFNRKTMKRPWLRLRREG